MSGDPLDCKPEAAKELLLAVFGETHFLKMMSEYKGMTMMDIYGYNWVQVLAVKAARIFHQTTNQLNLSIW